MAEALDQLMSRPQLRLLTCGSVDDGKSSLIGHLLLATGNVPRDLLERWQRDCARIHGRAGVADYSLLLDGLEAEREQGITIDVAWRYFGTARARFVVADCPGHEQYTANMACGASACEAAVVLVDASAGLKPQTRRHVAIATRFGVRALVLALNKCDLIGFDQDRIEALTQGFAAMAGELGATSICAIPLSAKDGDNLVLASARTPWYSGPTLLAALEDLARTPAASEGPARFAVQAVHRAGLDYRLLAGIQTRGELKVGDSVLIQPGAAASVVSALYRSGHPSASLRAGEVGSVRLRDEIDVGRGAVLSARSAPVTVANRLEGSLLCLSADALLPGRAFDLKLGFQSVGARIHHIEHRIDVEQGGTLPADRLAAHQLGRVELVLDRALAIDLDPAEPRAGAYILVDRLSKQTVGAGLIDHASHVATDLHWQALNVDKLARAAQKGQRPRCLWFTGLSGAGKSSIANEVEKRLLAAGRHTYLLDGDNIRHGLNRDLGFSEADRIENIRRAAEVARLMVDAGLIVLVSFISPFRAERAYARALFEPGEFIEVYVDTPLAVAEARDVKGLYKRARAGLIRNFTGIDSPYEPPLAPELHLYTPDGTVQSLAERVVATMLQQG